MSQTMWPGGLWPISLWPLGLWPAAPTVSASATTRMTSESFPFKGSFPGLYDGQGHSDVVDFACQTVETEWYGACFTMFANLPAALMLQRRLLIEAYLVAWWLGDMYPTKMRGVQGDGGMPLSGKSIGGVSISRREIEAQPALVPLLSNAFGVKAATMILSRVERSGLLP